MYRLHIQLKKVWRDVHNNILQTSMSLLSNLWSLFGKVMHDEEEEKATQSYLTFTYVNVFRIQQIKSAEFCFLTFKGHESREEKKFLSLCCSLSFLMQICWKLWLHYFDSRAEEPFTTHCSKSRFFSTNIFYVKSKSGWLTFYWLGWFEFCRSQRMCCQNIFFGQKLTFDLVCCRQ